jgi:hypothetical protein
MTEQERSESRTKEAAIWTASVWFAFLQGWSALWGVELFFKASSPEGTWYQWLLALWLMVSIPYWYSEMLRCFRDARLERLGRCD